MEDSERAGRAMRLLVVAHLDAVSALEGPFPGGTLRPRPAAQAMAALADLASVPDTRVAVVSDLPVGALRYGAAAWPRGVDLLEECGKESIPGAACPPTAVRMPDQGLRRLHSLAEEIVRTAPGAAVEDHAHRVVVRLPSRRSRTARLARTELGVFARSLRGVLVEHGEDTVEMSVAPHDRSEVVAALRERHAADHVVEVVRAPARGGPDRGRDGRGGTGPGPHEVWVARTPEDAVDMLSTLFADRASHVLIHRSTPGPGPFLPHTRPA